MKFNGIKYAAVIIIGLGILTLSCEKVIKIDLNNVQRRLVLEGVISSQPGQSQFTLSKTGDFYQPSTFPKVSGAEVIVSDIFGNIDTLRESQPGIYIADSLRGVIGRTYFANVTVEGVTYTASSRMPNPILIDSMRTEYQPGGGFGPDADKGYRLSVYFIDHPGVDDFCRIRIVKNDSLLPDYFLYDDKFSDGNYIEYNDFGRVFSYGDTIKAEILSMDKPVYDYFKTLTDVVASQNGEEMRLAPANPNSNWSNNALGYFGAFSISDDTILVR
jgi:hypothetical protein